MATTMAERKKRLEEAEADMRGLDWPADPRDEPKGGAGSMTIAQHKAQLKRQEEAEQKRRRAELDKIQASHAQYAETHQKWLDSIIGQNPKVDALAADLAEREAEFDELVIEHSRVCAQLRALDDNTKADFSQVSMKELLATAATREKARVIEQAALISTRDELQRRVGLAEGAVVEARAAWLRERRIAVHHRCDQLIAEMRPALEGAHALFDELRKCEDAVRGLGAPRQTFGFLRLTSSLATLVDNWDEDLKNVVRFSERYDRG
ncbi:MAG: hypothetical protein R3C14_28780 [Caldilineaceae bacterium]